MAFQKWTDALVVQRSPVKWPTRIIREIITMQFREIVSTCMFIGKGNYGVLRHWLHRG
jgi:hypothetical protein